MNANLSNIEALRVMRMYLESYDKRCKGTADINDILGDTAIVDDENITMDPAAWHDWQDAVEKVLNAEKNTSE